MSYKCYTENASMISLHDARCNQMSYENNVLAFEFPEGFSLLFKKDYSLSGKARMECHIIDADKDGITVNVYQKDLFGREFRQDWSERLTSALNDGKFEFEFIDTFQGYQRVLFKGYLWFDSKPYHYECEIELHTDQISFMWDEE